MIYGYIIGLRLNQSSVYELYVMIYGYIIGLRLNQSSVTI